RRTPRQRPPERTKKGASEPAPTNGDPNGSRREDLWLVAKRSLPVAKVGTTAEERRQTGPLPRCARISARLKTSGGAPRDCRSDDEEYCERLERLRDARQGVSTSLVAKLGQSLLSADRGPGEQRRQPDWAGAVVGGTRPAVGRWPGALPLRGLA